MNTRLQVEHPVTEAVTGVDLVRAQLHGRGRRSAAVVAGALSQRGHAIEVRVYAEDPANGFVPQAGPLLALPRAARAPASASTQACAKEGPLPVNYDPLLAKLTVTAETRDAAIARAIAALRAFPVLGIRTNIPFLGRILDHPDFRAGHLHTGFIDQHLEDLLGRAMSGRRRSRRRHARRSAQPRPTPRCSGRSARHRLDPWATLRGGAGEPWLTERSSSVAARASIA